MNQFDEYQNQAVSRAARDLDTSMEYATCALGLTGEAGEVADMIKKHLGHGHELDGQKLLHELGDVLWYIAALANVNGWLLSEVAEANVEKLRKRYPNGFSTEASKARADEHQSPLAQAACNHLSRTQVSPKLARNKAKVAAPAPVVREPAPKPRGRVKQASK